MQTFEACLPYLPLIPYIASFNANERIYEQVGTSVQRILGYTPDEFVKVYLSRIHRDDISKMEALFRQLTQSNTKTFTIEYRLLHNHGQYIWIRDEGHAIQDKGDRKIYGSLTDVTSRKQLELLTELSRDIVCRHKRDGTYEYVSPASEHILGRSPDDLLGTSPYDYIHPEDLQRTRQTAHEMALQGQLYTLIEYRIRHQAGHYIWLETYTQPIFDDKQQVIGLVSNSRDVTQRHMSEERMRESEILYRTLVENFPGIVAVVNDGGEYLFVNEQGWRPFNLTPDERKGKTAHDLFPKEDADTFVERIRSVLATGLARTDINPLFLGDETRWIQSTIAPLMDGEETSTRVLTNSIDITALKQVELQLSQQKQELETSNQELEQFAYVASHDLQEPLRAITGYLDLLNQLYSDKLDETAMDFIRETMDGAVRMRELIEGLLEYSRVNRKNKPFVMIDLNRVLNDAIANLMMSLHENNVNIENNGLPTVEVDRVQMIQVFQNLISNAVKFSRESPINIHIGAEDAGNKWHIFVQDNGIGIHPDFYERIFTIFQRLHTRDEIPGTGIGLALVRKIIQRHGGEIWVDSKVDQGTTFRFSLNKCAEPESE